jgi:hypothetical protein
LFPSDLHLLPPFLVFSNVVHDLGFVSATYDTFGVYWLMNGKELRHLTK